MRGDQRRINFYDIEIGTNKALLPSASASELHRGLRLAYTQGLARLTIDRGNKSLSIVEIDDRADVVVYYLMNSDISAPDVRFSDETTGRSRMGGKAQTEGRDFGAHLIISKTANLPGRYLALLEKNTGLSRGLVSRLLRASLKNLYDVNNNTFVQPHPNGARDMDGNPKTIPYRPMVDFYGYPSDTFINQLNGGRLLEVTLIHSEQQTPMGGAPWLEAEESTIRYKPTAGMGQQVANIWNNLLPRIQANARTYENARVKFHSNETGKSETVMLASSTGTLLDDRFVKTKLLTRITPPLPECLDGINANFANRMIALM